MCVRVHACLSISEVKKKTCSKITIMDFPMIDAVIHI